MYLLRGSHRRNISLNLNFRFGVKACGLNCGLTPNKPTQQLLDYVGFNIACYHQFYYMICLRRITVKSPWSSRQCVGKARVRVPGQTSKRNTKSISSTISSQHISGKNSESKNKIAMKSFSKNLSSKSPLNCRSRHLCIKKKLAHIP